MFEKIKNKIKNSGIIGKEKYGKICPKKKRPGIRKKQMNIILNLKKNKCV